MSSVGFIFVVCQVGAEAALKAELARSHPDFRFAFSRPGFVTFKLPPGHDTEQALDLKSVFARTCGFSLGKVTAASDVQRATEFWTQVAGRPIDHLHVWQRDRAVPGEFDFEPGIAPAAREAAQALLFARADMQKASASLPGDEPSAGVGQSCGEAASQGVPFPLERGPGAERMLPVNLVARPGQRILDCVLVDPDTWWIGYHRAATLPQRWPGGTPKIDLPAEAVSRAYLKLTEALLWSRLPIAPKDRCVEIGSSPGGSCQALLDRGLLVTGIDPAAMHPAVLTHPNFRHIQARAADLPRREFRGVKWLVADSNVAPQHTLDSIEHIVTNRQVQIRGMLLTLKLLQWELAEEIPAYLERIRSWGFHYVRARQLAFNRQEICLAALRGRQQRRTPPRQRPPRRPA